MRGTNLLAGATVAVAATLGPAAGAFAANAVFGGSTTGGEAIVITADKAGAKLKSAVIAWRAECGDGLGLPLATPVTATSVSPGFSPGPKDLVMSRNGKRRFSGTQLLALNLGDASAGIKVTMAGRLGAKVASGTLSAEATIVENATGNTQTTCRTDRLRWRASRAPGRIYAGASSQGEPFVAKVNARRKRVTDVLVGWGADCDPSGSIQFPEQLRNFPLASTGRFGDKWDDTVQDGDGGTRSFAYSLTGRLSRRSGRGTFRVAVSDRDAAGATTRSCDTGSIGWRATTG